LRTTNYLTRAPFVIDWNSVNLSTGRQIDWSRVAETYRQGTTYTVTLGASASQSATSITVTALPVALTVGQLLDFGGAKYARVAAPAAVGATTVTVDALPTALAGTETATVGRDGKKFLPAGTVVGGGTTTVYPLVSTGTAVVTADSNTGNGTFGAVTVSAGAKVGTYRVVITEPASNAGTFSVEDPDGIQIGEGTVAVAFSAGGLAFTIADGATDFVAGDSWTIAVTLTNAPIGFLATDALEDDPSAAKTGYGIIVGGSIYENLLPEATGSPKVISASVKAQLDQTGTGFYYEQYGDTRTAQ
jgi:hypothetical protein